MRIAGSTVFALAFAAGLNACSGSGSGDGGSPAPSPTPAATPSPTPSPAATTLGHRSESFVAGGRTYHAHYWYPSGDAAAASADPYGNGFAARLAADGAVSGSGLPLIIFAHGDSGCATQSLYLTEALARHGYVVAAVNYADASTSCPGGEGFSNDPPFGAPEQWTPASHADRLADTRALIDHVLQLSATGGAWLSGKIDPARIGFMGHSLGGYAGAAMGQASGPWQSWYEPRMRAALLLSPYVSPFNLDANKPWTIPIPVMLQGGTEDIGITPALPAVYGYLRQRRYFVTFDQRDMVAATGHFAWTNTLCNDWRNDPDGASACIAARPQAAAIVHYSESFLDTWVAGTSAAVDVGTSPAVSSYAYCATDNC